MTHRPLAQPSPLLATTLLMALAGLVATAGAQTTTVTYDLESAWLEPDS